MGKVMLILPEFIDAELWDDFKGHREELNKPLTERAEKRMLNRLAKFDRDGFDINDALERSIVNGWQDVFPDKRKGQSDGANRKSTPAERVLAANVLRFGTPSR